MLNMAYICECGYKLPHRIVYFVCECENKKMEFVLDLPGNYGQKNSLNLTVYGGKSFLEVCVLLLNCFMTC